MRIAYDNLFDDYSPEVSSENGNYPGENTQDSRLSKVWRTTALSSQTITVDAGTGQTLTPTYAAILAHNLTTGGTYKIQGSSSTAFSDTGMVDQALTRIDTNYIGAFFTGSAKRHWRFLVKDTGSADSYMEIGRLWFGTYITITNSVQNELSEEQIDSSVYSLSYSGQHYGDQGYIRRAYNLQFPLFNSTQKTEFQTFVSSVKRYSNFITIFDSSNLTKLTPVYGFIQNNPVYSHIYDYQWSCSLRIEEVR